MDEPGLFAALAEFNDAVMAQAEPLGYVGDCGLLAVGGSGDVEQELMLLGMEAGVGGAAFAEVEELAEGVAELGQGLESLPVVGVAMGVAIERWGRSPHEKYYIALRYIRILADPPKSNDKSKCGGSSLRSE
jgi:hypothetical protein